MVLIQHNYSHKLLYKYIREISFKNQAHLGMAGWIYWLTKSTTRDSILLSDKVHTQRVRWEGGKEGRERGVDRDVSVTQNF